MAHLHQQQASGNKSDQLQSTPGHLADNLNGHLYFCCFIPEMCSLWLLQQWSVSTTERSCLLGLPMYVHVLVSDPQLSYQQSPKMETLHSLLVIPVLWYQMHIMSWLLKQSPKTESAISLSVAVNVHSWTYLYTCTVMRIQNALISLCVLVVCGVLVSLTITVLHYGKLL